MNLSALIADFLRSLEFGGNTSQLTIKNYGHYLKRFLEFSKDLDPKEIDLALVGRYKLYLSHYLDPKTKKPLKRITQNYFMIALRAFLRYLAKINVNCLPAQQVKLIETEPRFLKTLDNSDLRQLLDAPNTTKIDGIRDRAILEALFSTGLRVSELGSLNREDINSNTRELEILGKGGKERVVFISDSAANWLEKYLSIRKDTFKPLFIRFQGKVDLTNFGEKMRLTTRSIERVVEKYVKALGLSVKATPQTLRHSFATDLLVNGTDMKSVQEILGHNNISTTQIYTTITNP